MAVFNVAREPGTQRDSWFYHIQDGLQYHRNRELNGSIYFKCVHNAKGCWGRALFDPVEGFFHTSEHNHEPNHFYPDEMFVRRRVLYRCRGLEYTSYREIYDQEVDRFPPEVRAHLTFERLRTSMRTARMSRFPPIPQDLRQLTAILQDPVHRLLSMTDDGQDNMYAASVTDPLGGHHILFTSNRRLQLMRELKIFHADGTFKTVPAGMNCEQVFCIVGVWAHQIIPLAYALMENRSQVAYTALFQLLRHLLGPNIELTRVITDFEAGQQNAWEEVFGCRVQGCLWHFDRRILIAAGELHLIVPMREIAQVKFIVRLIMALPLLPEHLIRQGFLIICTEAQEEGNYIFQIVHPLLEWVHTYWILSDIRIRRMCVYESAQRTNNACESHNRDLRRILGNHPNIYKFIEGLVTIEKRSQATLIAVQRGNRITRPRKSRSIANDDRITQLSQDLVNLPGNINAAIMRFLRGASHLMDGLMEEALL